jgi:carbonic anhydrase
MKTAIKLLTAGNEKWREEIMATNPEFFTSLAKGQSPEFLWIGCADSRVPATQLANMMPGSIFVHRNISNMVVHSDTNMLSVVYYAVKVLKVKYIIICGHYGCGGVKAAMSNNKHDLILDSWLTHIKDVYSKNAKELNAIEDENKRWDRCVELNVIEQVKNMAKLSFIQEQWQEGQYPHIHGIVYSLQDGKIVDMDYSINSNETLEDVFRYEK